LQMFVGAEWIRFAAFVFGTKLLSILLMEEILHELVW